MEFPEFVITLVGMVMGYKLISQIFLGRRDVKLKRFAAMAAHPQPVMDAPPGVLQARADELKRRLETLEEIIASERSQR